MQVRLVRAVGKVGMLLAMLMMVLRPDTARAEVLHIAAASSLTEAVAALAEAFSADHEDAAMVHSVAATSTLARQALQGGPAHVILTANVQWMAHLVAEQAVRSDAVHTIARNRLVLVCAVEFCPKTPVIPSEALAKVPPGQRLAVANPDHVPAGDYAKQSLTTLGLWAAWAPRLAPTANVRTALLQVQRGETPLGIVYATDAGHLGEGRIAAWFPEDSHAPILYQGAMVAARPHPLAETFMAYVMSPKGQTILANHGFLAP